MTAPTSVPFLCYHGSTDGETFLVEALARRSGMPVEAVAVMPCADVHSLMAAFVTGDKLARIDRALLAEVPAQRARYTVGSLVFMLAVMVGLTGCVAIVLRALL
jgi:hypothetical protein